MSISKHLHRKLQETLGAEAAEDLVSRLETMDANRADLSELRHEMQLGFARVDARFQQVDARFQQVDAQFKQLEERLTDKLTDKIDVTAAGLNAALEKGLREQTRFFFLAWSVVMAMIVGLYAR